MPTIIKYGYVLPPAKNWDTEWSELDDGYGEGQELAREYDKVSYLQDWYDEHVKEIESLAKELYYLRRVEQDNSQRHKEREESLLADMEELEKEKDKLLEDCYNSEYVKKLEKNIKDYYNDTEKLESQILKLQDENTEIRKQGEKEFEYLRTKIEKLEKENERLKNPVIPDRDARCSQFDMRIGYSYVSSCIKEALPSLYLGEGYGEPEIDVDNLPEVVYDEVAKTIDGSINAYVFEDPNELTIHEYIYDDVLQKLQKLREEGVLEEEE
jgi:cob(I)alamin adenosyltransferase